MYSFDLNKVQDPYGHTPDFRMATPRQCQEEK